MPQSASGGRRRALAGATGLLAINFWAWSLLSPLASTYAADLKLAPFAISALLAMPVIVGSLGRIPFGILTDRYGGKAMFAAVCMLASIPAAYLVLARSYPQLIAAGLCLGIAGASFAVGVPFVNAWFPKRQRGLALGIYATGNAGTAASGLFTLHLVANLGRPITFAVLATTLLATGLLMAFKGRNAPGWRAANGNALARLAAAATWPPTRKLSLLYAVTFGAFVAFGLYLPVLLHAAYGLDVTDAAARAAGFVLLATAARPAGGWLSDRLGGARVLQAALAGVVLLALIVAFDPSLQPYGTIAYLSLAAMLGVGNGAIFAIIGHTCSPRLTGGVTGIIGAAGGLGGFFPPLVLGASAQLFHSYAVALLLLAAVGLAVLPCTRGLEQVRPADT